MEKRDFDVVFGGYLLKRLKTVKALNKSLIVENNSLKQKINEFSKRNIPPQIYNTPQPSTNEVSFSQQVKVELSVSNRIMFASKAVATEKRKAPSMQRLFDIHKAGRPISQKIKANNLDQVMKSLLRDPTVLLMRSSMTGETLLHVAAAAGAVSCCEFFLKFSEELKEAISKRPEVFTMEKMQEVFLTVDSLPVGFDPFVTDIFGKTPLHYAADSLQVNVCYTFMNLKSPYDPNLFVGETAPQDSAGLTPAGSSSMKRARTANEADRRKRCNQILHSPGDASISPKTAFGRRQSSRPSKYSENKLKKGAFESTRSKLRLNFSEDDKLQQPNMKFGVCELPGFRVSMEDTNFASPNLVFEKQNIAVDLFGVFDGHGGSGASRFCAQAFPEIFTELFAEKGPNMDLSESMKNSLIETCWNVEQQLEQKQSFRLNRVVIRPAMGDEPAQEEMQALDDSGTTLVVCAYTIHQGNGYIAVANVGDCRALMVVLDRSNGVKDTTQLSRDHKPEDSMNERDIEFFEGERQRIEDAGGSLTEDHYVLWNKDKVKEKLNMTRSIGDFKFKNVVGVSKNKQPVVAEPEITILNLGEQPDVKSEDKVFIVLACDGVWDVMTNEDVGSWIARSTLENLEEMANALLLDCLKKGSEDNLTAIIIRIPVPANPEVSTPLPVVATPQKPVGTRLPLQNNLLREDVSTTVTPITEFQDSQAKLAQTFEEIEL